VLHAELLPNYVELMNMNGSLIMNTGPSMKNEKGQVNYIHASNTL